MYEIYLNSSNNGLVVENHKSGESIPLEKMDFNFFRNAENTILEQYPESHSALVQEFGDSAEMRFARVRRFFACNFSIKDGKPDIDEDWNFNLEVVPCPARITGKCKKEICEPKLNSEFTRRELEILKYFIDAFTEDEIGEALFISPRTVHNHIQNIYKKTGVSGSPKPDIKLIAYVHRKNIF